jgi:DNA-binding protein H-NS
MMEISKLEQELKEKLPLADFTVDIEKKIAYYYDWHGVTYRDNMAEQEIANSYVAKSISDKAGFPVKVTVYHENGNGHFTCQFERILEE